MSARALPAKPRQARGGSVTLPRDGRVWSRPAVQSRFAAREMRAALFRRDENSVLVVRSLEHRHSLAASLVRASNSNMSAMLLIFVQSDCHRRRRGVRLPLCCSQCLAQAFAFDLERGQIYDTKDGAGQLRKLDAIVAAINTCRRLFGVALPHMSRAEIRKLLTSDHIEAGGDVEAAVILGAGICASHSSRPTGERS